MPVPSAALGSSIEATITSLPAAQARARPSGATAALLTAARSSWGAAAAVRSNACLASASSRACQAAHASSRSDPVTLRHAPAKVMLPAAPWKACNASSRVAKSVCRTSSSTNAAPNRYRASPAGQASKVASETSARLGKAPSAARAKSRARVRVAKSRPPRSTAPASASGRDSIQVARPSSNQAGGSGNERCPTSPSSGSPSLPGAKVRGSSRWTRCTNSWRSNVASASSLPRPIPTRLGSSARKTTVGRGTGSPNALNASLSVVMRTMTGVGIDSCEPVAAPAGQASERPNTAATRISSRAASRATRSAYGRRAGSS